MLKQIKMRTSALALGILLTFGLIAAAAPNLPNNAETLVTEPRPRRGDRGRQNRPPRNERPPRPIEDFFDF